MRSVRPIEQTLKTSSSIKQYSSFSNDGMSIIMVEYEFGTDMKAKEAELQQTISGVQQMLPATALAPKVAALNFDSMPVVQLAVSSSLPPEQLAGLLGTRVVSKLQAIDGVQAVTLSGVQQMQLNIQLKPQKVAALGVTPTQIMTAVTQANVTTGAGSVTSGSIVYPITLSATAQTERALDGATLPAGATWELGGATQATNDVFRSLGIAMLVAILLVYIIMVATFRSLVNPFILLVSIPFAAVGAVLALVITSTSLGMPSLIGLLMLIGIVVTNAIVLLDLVEQFRRKGMDARTAVIEGGRRRLRPILMTAIATILALIPMALGIGGKGGFLSTPLAVVVIGGLFTSTFLTLILVPVLYLAFDRLRPAGAFEPDDDDFAPVMPEPAPAD